MKNKSKLYKIRTAVLDDGCWDDKEYVYHVKTAHAFSQISGYLKYTRQKNGPVFYRGQAKLYSEMKPSLFRSVKTWSATHRCIERINIYIKASKKSGSFLNNTPDYANEPILQHYGIKTRWIDLVDNAWVALWFACHTTQSTGRGDEFIHFLPRKEGNAYIVLMQPGAERRDTKRPGVWITRKAEVIDLRRAAPSIYLRPHSQHGLLMKRSSITEVSDALMNEFIVGVIRVSVCDAFEWLGGSMMSVHYLFPPPVYDHGYRLLLDKAPKGNKTVGEIQHIGA